MVLHWTVGADQGLRAAKDDDVETKSEFVQAYSTEDNTLLLKISTPPIPPKEMPLAFVLDFSLSMKGENTRLLVESMVRIMYRVRDETPICIVCFADRANVLLDTKSLTAPQRTEAICHLQGIKAHGQTNLHAGLLEAAKFIAKLPNPQKSNTLVLTDGQANEGITDPKDLACLIPYGRQHAIMFTAAADHQYPRSLTTISKNNTAHFVDDKEELEAKLMNVVATMSTCDMHIVIDDGTTIVPSKRLQPTNFLIFDKAPTRNMSIHVAFGNAPKTVVLASGQYKDFEGRDLSKEIIELHNCAWKLRLKLEKINDNVQKVAAKVDNDNWDIDRNDWVEVFGTLQVEETLAEPDTLYVQMRDLAVGDSAEPIFRSLVTYAKEISGIRDDLLELPSGAVPPPSRPPVEPLLPVAPPTIQMVDFDRLSAEEQQAHMINDGNNFYKSLAADDDANDDANDEPVYRSIAIGSLEERVAPSHVQRKIWSDEAIQTMKANEMIEARNNQARSQYDRLMSSYDVTMRARAVRRGTLNHRILALNEM